MIIYTYVCPLSMLGLGKQSRSIFMEIDAKASASPQTTPSSPAPASAKRINPVWPPEQKENVSMKNCGLYWKQNKKKSENL